MSSVLFLYITLQLILQTIRNAAIAIMNMYCFV